MQTGFNQQFFHYNPDIKKINADIFYGYLEWIFIKGITATVLDSQMSFSLGQSKFTEFCQLNLELKSKSRLES